MGITKEQAMAERCFIEIEPVSINPPLNTHYKYRTWRANGKCKTWKRDATRFKLPIKHGLYTFGYITESNCHLFNIQEWQDNEYHN